MAGSAAQLAIKFAGSDDGASAAAEKVSGALDSVHERANKLKEGLGEVAKTMAGFVAGQTLMSFGHSMADQLSEVISGTQAYGEKLRLLAMETGATTEQSAGLLLMFKDQGVNADDASRAFERFAKGLQGVIDQQNGAIPGGKTTLEVLKDMGVNADNASGKVRPFIDVLSDVADKFKAMPDGTEKTARAMQLFGRSGADLLPVLNLGKEGLEETEAAAKKYGLALSADNVAKVHDFTLAHKDMDAALEGVRLQLGTKLMPVLTGMIGVLTEGVTRVTGFFSSLKVGETLGPVFSTIGAAFGKIVDMVKALGKGDANSFFLALSQGFGLVGGERGQVPRCDRRRDEFPLRHVAARFSPNPRPDKAIRIGDRRGVRQTQKRRHCRRS